jgi:peptide/nickel transport system substrate-binding protein
LRAFSRAAARRAGAGAGRGAIVCRARAWRELVASIRSEPATYNRYAPAGASAATGHAGAPDARARGADHRATDEPEPWLAERWDTSADGLIYTIAPVAASPFSDGTPFTSADVLSFRAAHDPAVKSSLASVLSVNGKPLGVGARRHHGRRQASGAVRARSACSIRSRCCRSTSKRRSTREFANAWTPSKPLTDIAGLGPFVLSEHVAGQRLVLVRNPHYFRRDTTGVQLPYLDRLTLAVVPDQNNEALRLEAGESDLMANGDIRPQDHAAFKRLVDQGRLTLIDVNVNVDPDFLSFNLRPARASDRPWMKRKEFRQAISCGVDRQAIANAVYLGAAVPIFGPITPGNQHWHVPDLPQCVTDRVRARQLFIAAGLTDRDGDGMLRTPPGRPRGSRSSRRLGISARRTTVLQEQLPAGIAVDSCRSVSGLRQRWSRVISTRSTSASSPAPPIRAQQRVLAQLRPFHFWNPAS